ncbi:endonuclease [Malaciobacter molluscorum]|uniref:DNA/RNA non-specific endonuclease n=1 Tax=Malaciobacter molluscorum TaxID=1032072 RepID=UPI00100A963A|nr:DNA/RNA non-specific endonuclease [Malaciobacter molluscorum]RXJ94817.1 endonuclease [Malaciobacter molluscorum]
MKKRLLLVFIFLASLSYATSLEDYVDRKQCDQIVDKQLYKICYSYKYKGALSGWVTLYGDKVNTKDDIKKRPRFYNEKNIPMKYRTKYKDYTGFGKNWNRGHFIVADADFDYDVKALNKAYSMANIIPQAAKVNQRTWIKVERYGRVLASKLGYINSISIAKYDNQNHKIKNDIVIPTTLYRIYYNNDAKFERCFKYENFESAYRSDDKLKDHEIECKRIKRF